MNSEKVIYTVRDGLATLTLNIPDKLNALSSPVFEELSSHVGRIEAATATVGCVVLRGNGRSFSAGHDLAVLSEGEKPGELEFQSKVIERLANLPQPVITAVHGHCYTGALELALAGEIILASANARFADTHAKWSLVPFWGLSQRLPRRIGAAKAREMMYTCRTYSGAEAAAMGLANACFADDAFDVEVEKFVRSMLANSWYSLRENKRLMNDTEGMTLQSGIAHEVFRSRGFGPDMHERIAAFTARKK